MELKNFELPKFHIDDANGSPLSGGKVYFYEAGTSTLKNTYADKDGLTINSNPVILDSRGEADIFLESGSYKILVTDSDDVTILTRDDYNTALLFPLVEIMPGDGITVDNTDPQYPVIAFNTATRISAYASTDQSLAAGVTTKVLFDTEEKDSLGEFSSSRFTADNTGRYLVSVNVLLHCPAAQTGYRLELFKNGVELRRLDHKRITYAGDETISGCTDIDMVAGDYIEIYVYASAATSTISGSLHTFMTITRTL